MRDAFKYLNSRVCVYVQLTHVSATKGNEMNAKDTYANMRRP